MEKGGASSSHNPSLSINSIDDHVCEAVINEKKKGGHRVPRPARSLSNLLSGLAKGKRHKIKRLDENKMRQIRDTAKIDAVSPIRFENEELGIQGNSYEDPERLCIIIIAFAIMIVVFSASVTASLLSYMHNEWPSAVFNFCIVLGVLGIPCMTTAEFRWEDIIICWCIVFIFIISWNVGTFIAGGYKDSQENPLKAGVAIASTSIYGISLIMILVLYKTLVDLQDRTKPIQKRRNRYWHYVKTLRARLSHKATEELSTEMSCGPQTKNNQNNSSDHYNNSTDNNDNNSYNDIRKEPVELDVVAPHGQILENV